MITSINAGESFDKIQHSFTIKSLHRVGTERTDFSITKAIYDKPTANLYMTNPQPTLYSTVKD